MTERFGQEEDEARMSRGDEARGREALFEIEDFLKSYRLCAQMLGINKYERKRTGGEIDEWEMGEEICGESESFWRLRMLEVERLIDKMPSDREKMVLFYHYIKGKSIERIANLAGFSNRTGYRLHRKGLRTAEAIRKRMRMER